MVTLVLLKVYSFLFQTVTKLVELVNKMDAWITEIPPIDQPQRFGNKAYRDWFARLKEVGSSGDVWFTKSVFTNITWMYQISLYFFYTCYSV